MKYRSFSLFLYFLLIGFFTNAQMGFQSLEDKKDFTFGKIFNIKTGFNGMLWIASDGGVIRYNSKELYKYTRGSGLPENSENTIRHILVDQDGVIWATSSLQLLKYNQKTDQFDIAATTTFQIKSITKDGNGNIWVSGNDGLFKYNIAEKQLKLYASENIEFIKGIDDYVYYTSNGTLFRINYKSKEKKEVSSFPSAINSIYSRNNSIYIGLFNGSVYEFTNENEPSKILEFEGPVVDIEYNTDHYYFAIDLKGIWKYDNNLLEVEEYSNNPKKPIWLSGPKIFDIEFDRENLLWVAQYNFGIDYLDPFFLEVKNLKPISNDTQSLRDSFIRVIEEDSEGRIWFGTKIGLSIYEPIKNNWIQFPNFDKFVLDLEQKENKMLASTYRGGLFEIALSDFKVKKIEEKSLAEDAFDYIFKIDTLINGDLFFGRFEQPILIKKKNGEYTSLLEYDAISIAQNKDTIYLGNTKEVFELNTSTYKSNAIVEFTSNKYFFSRINSMTNFKDQTLLIATTGAGILVCSKVKDSIIQVSKEDGLLTDNILNVNVINDSTLLAATDYGLSKIDILDDGFIITNFTKEDGFINLSYLEKAFAKLNDGKFIYGGTAGASIFDPNILLRKDTVPPIFFESVETDDKSFIIDSKLKVDSFNTIEKIVLQPGNQSLAFDFTTIKTSSPKLITYSYKLEGFDEDWSLPTKDGTVEYQIQKSGIYAFHVRASNDGLNWVNERKIEVKIEPFWWKSNLAYLLYFLAFVSLIFIYYYTSNQIAQKRNVQNQLEFFSNMIHEVKTPLSILISSLSREEKKKEEISVDKLRGTISRLSSLFEQMLNFQSVIYKDSDLTIIDKINLKSYIQDVVDDFKPMLEERNLGFKVDAKMITPEFYFSKNGLNRILYNLISNAIKYSKENGEILLTLKTLNNEKLQLEIQDNGIGIPEDQQANIFKRFYRARNVQNSNFSGSGLGLLIVKNIVDKTDGSIWFESVKNEGTTFYVKLNSFEEEYIHLEEKTFVEVSSIKDLEYKNVSILLVEDNDELREELFQYLSIKFTVNQAKNGKVAYSSLMELQPDIIITDLIMPEMDGIELAKKIKENIEFSHIPIIMISVLRDKKQVYKSIEEGVVEFIYKPVDPELLIAKVINLLNWQSNLKNKYLNESEIGEAYDTRNKTDKEFIEELENLVVQNVLTNIGVTDLCEEIGMSRTSLYNKLKKLIDLSPQEFIIYTKLKLAKKELRNTDKTITEIAYDTGFFDQSHLSRSFKKTFGESPTSYRSKIQKEIDKLE